MRLQLARQTELRIRFDPPNCKVDSTKVNRMNACLFLVDDAAFGSINIELSIVPLLHGEEERGGCICPYKHKNQCSNGSLISKLSA